MQLKEKKSSKVDYLQDVAVNCTDCAGRRHSARIVIIMAIAVVAVIAVVIIVVHI